MTQGAVLSHNPQTATAWSMTTAVLLEDTSSPVELRCNSVELTHSIRDERELLDHVTKEFEFDDSELDGLRPDIADAKERIYQAALDGNWDLVRSTSEYATGIERQYEAERARIEERRSARLRTVHGLSVQFLAERYGVTDADSLEYFVPSLNPALTYADESVRRDLPFLFGADFDETAMGIFVKQSVSALDLQSESDDEAKMLGVVAQLPLPVYGSKPEKFVSLKDAMKWGGSVGAVGYSQYIGGPIMMLTTMAATFIIWFATPHVTTLRDHTNKWVEDWSKERLKYRKDR